MILDTIADILDIAANTSVSCQINFRLFHLFKHASSNLRIIRCETCKNYSPKQPLLSDSCNKYNVLRQGPNFGCIHWESL